MKHFFTKSLSFLLILILLCSLFCFTACDLGFLNPEPDPEPAAPISLDEVPPFTNKAYVEINGNVPFFTDEEKRVTKSFESYSDLDALGRCGVAYSCVGRDLMPTEKRESIGVVKPSGWHTVKYDVVDGKYLYNRCHLIGYQLTAENANNKNLITGTRYLNVIGMLPFENMVADYVKETNNHVLYRVTPIYQGNNLVASGLLMEGYSVEDNGEGVLFCIYCYNNQPGVTIRYSDGESWLGDVTVNEETADATEETGTIEEVENAEETITITYILNTSSKKFHYESCSGAAKISENNRGSFTGDREELIAEGYSPCGTCKP